MIRVTDAQKLFLSLVKASVFQKETVDFSCFDSFNNWQELLTLCRMHDMGSIVFEQLNKNFSSKIPPELLTALKNEVVFSCSVQMSRSSAFLTLYSKLCDEGIKPLVLKGEALRSLYPQPSARSSLDEDILIDENCYEDLSKKLLSLDFEQVQEGAEDKHWVNKKMAVYLEIHLSPFPKNNIYNLWNELFDKPINKINSIKTPQCEVYTLFRADNLLFLFLHAAKHFIYSGVGIKQLLDIALFINAYKNEIDFQAVEKKLEAAGVLKFACDIHAIIKEYLYSQANSILNENKINEALLLDVLEGGSLGSGSIQRRASASITSAGFKKQSKILTLKKILFPNQTRLSQQFPFVKKSPLLLPFAWVMRIFCFIKSGASLSTLKAGRKRKKLLKEYQL